MLSWNSKSKFIYIPNDYYALDILNEKLPNSLKDLENKQILREQFETLLKTLSSQNDGSIPQLLLLAELILLKEQHSQTKAEASNILEYQKILSALIDVYSMHLMLQNIILLQGEILANVSVTVGKQEQPQQNNLNQPEPIHIDLNKPVSENLGKIIGNIFPQLQQLLLAADGDSKPELIEKFTKLETKIKQTLGKKPPATAATQKVLTAQQPAVPGNSLLSNLDSLFSIRSVTQSTPQLPVESKQPQAVDQTAPLNKRFPLHYQDEKLVAISETLLKNLSTATESVITLTEMPDYYLVRGQSDKAKSSNEWFVLDKELGSGAFGVVKSCRHKIIIEKQNFTIKPVNKVAKIQTLGKSNDEQLKEIKKEVKLLEVHQITVDVNIEAQVQGKHQAFLVMDHCGENFKKFLPTFLKTATFEDRCLLANSLLSELLLLENNEIVHRDLKPDNVCVKVTKSKLSEELRYKGIFVDFGLAEKNDTMDDLVCGTPAYMAPELLDENNRQQASYASDVYAFTALIAAIFGARNPLRDKLTTDQHGKAQLHLPFCLDGLFEGDAFSEVEPELLEDIKNILQKMQDKNPINRPPAKFLVKYFSYVIERQHYFKEERQKICIQYNELTKSLSQLKLIESLVVADTFNSIKSIPFKSAATSKSQWRETLKQSCQNFHQRLKIPAPKEKIHSKIVTDLIQNQQTNTKDTKQENTKDTKQENTQYQDFQPFEHLDTLSTEIGKMNTSIKTCLETITAVLSDFSQSKKFTSTNSDGIKEMQILVKNSTLNDVDKLEKISAIAKSRTTGVRNSWSNSHFFGKGRHLEIQTFYETLAELDSKANLETLTSTLNQIKTQIESKIFVHQAKASV
jgi:serine/threonine protein kinase